MMKYQRRRVYAFCPVCRRFVRLSRYRGYAMTAHPHRVIFIVFQNNDVIIPNIDDAPSEIRRLFYNAYEHARYTDNSGRFAVDRERFIEYIRENAKGYIVRPLTVA